MDEAVTMRIAIVVVAAATTGCAGVLPEVRPPPRAPARVEPMVESAPASAPTPDKARVVLDADGERAKVWSLSIQNENALCMTPCAVDIRPGTHQLWFVSTGNGVRSSFANVAIAPHGSTTFVRHALGAEHAANEVYYGGMMMAIVGGTIAIAGAALTAAVALTDPMPHDRPRSRASSRSAAVLP